MSYQGRLEAAKTNTRSSERASPSICTSSSVFIRRLPSCSPLERDRRWGSPKGKAFASHDQSSTHSKDSRTVERVPFWQLTPSLPHSQEPLLWELEETSHLALYPLSNREEVNEHNVCSELETNRRTDNATGKLNATCCGYLQYYLPLKKNDIIENNLFHLYSRH